ncbi:tRNA(Ile)-lysidine synthase [Oikeobacillus pervagus]|uniref:tRNA(Ile)-lysidine synthase n=1 Tax=Oikeobacillus pervagus TaxID=1325931 RepID=A0AAJ1WLG8_9BACI|nr:tRNA lysidine(34) synthetase TilS [Oikeobacillus pervagus]MDQ0216181.1 tRNA(Ile)-lysidine synthase [Oikeobacillus pervagus]
MLDYERKVKEFIERHQIIKQGDRIVVGVSGGPDSLSLLHYLAKRQERYQIRVYAAHLDHMFRGQQSYEELQFVRNFCEDLHIPYVCDRIDVSSYMEESGTGLQEGARKVRYQFLKEVMNHFSANKLALGHHGDDQVETILMRLTRGSSGKGRSGIPYRRNFHQGEIIRPLLSLTKEMIEEYCAHFNLDPRRDPSNSKGDYTRNRFRLKVLPFLKGENGKVHEHFQRFSEEILEDEMFLQELTRQKMNNVWEKNEESIQLQVEAFQAMPLPLQRRGIQLILNYLYKGNPLYTSIHIQQILKFIMSDHPSGHLDLPDGLKVVKSYQTCQFTFETHESQRYEYTLHLGEQVTLPNGDLFSLQISTNFVDTHHAEIFLIDEKKVDLPLIIRTRKQGDRIQLKGSSHSKKIKKLFIDLKIPLNLRNEWPIITDNKGKVLWVPNIKKSNDERTWEDPHGMILVYKKQSSSRGQTNC